MKHTLTLNSGKEIELTEEEYKEVEEFFRVIEYKTIPVRYPFPPWPSDPVYPTYPTYPNYPIITCSEDSKVQA